VLQNVALVLFLGPTILARLLAAMGPGFIAMLSLSLTAEIFHSLFGAVGGSSSMHKPGPDALPAPPADSYLPTSVTGQQQLTVGTYSSAGGHHHQRVVVPAVVTAGEGSSRPVTVAATPDMSSKVVAVQLTHNAAAVLRDTEDEVRQQGGRFEGDV
jgi:hypothetical protein